MTLPEHRRDLFCFLFHTPHNSEGVGTLAGADESALFHRLDGIAIARQRAYFFIIFQVPQNGVAAERISFKLVSMLDVRKQVLFSLGEFRQQISSSLLRHILRPFAGGLALPFPESEHWRLRSAANPKILPEPKPRAVREHFVVPAIRSREIVRAQRSGVLHGEDALQPLDFGNGLFSVHPSQSSSTIQESVKP